MQFDHERLDVYQVGIELVGWVYELCERLSGLNRPARDQLLRASLSIPLNIAEGSGKRSTADRRRFFEFANGSAHESAAAIDILVACKTVTVHGNSAERGDEPQNIKELRMSKERTRYR